MAKRWSTFRVLGTLFLGTLVLAGLYAGWMVLATERRWEEVGREVERLVREETARETPRVRLRAYTLEGNAWPDYLRAIQTIEPLKGYETWNVIHRFRDTDNSNLRGEVKFLLNERRAGLDALSSGVRRKELAYVDREAWIRNGHPYYGSAVNNLVSMAVCDARLRAAVGDAAGAVERLIDVLQFSRDGSESGARWAEGAYQAGSYFVMEEAARLLQAGSLTPDLRSALERAIREVDDAPPNSEAAMRLMLAREGTLMRSRGLAGLAEAAMLSELRPGPGDFFSERRVMLSYFSDIEAMAAGARDRDTWSWPREKEYWDSCDSPLANKLGHPFIIGVTLRSARAHLRLARSALAWHATGDAPAVEDPFGDVLRFKVVGGQLTPWSVGSNGIDEGGGQRDLVIRARR